MYLKTLSLVNFKNYDSIDIQFNKKLNCFLGYNGQGKTNLLDAIYYLTFCKSFLNPVDRQNIQFDKEFFLIQGDFFKDDRTYNVYCGVKRNQKKVFKKNKKEYEKLSDHIGEFPLVTISPSDTNLISEGSETRRKFIDGIRAQYDKEYLYSLMQYNRVLLQRNALLKYFSKERTFNQDQLSVWDEQLISLGTVIFQKRKELIAEIQPVFQGYYNQISGSKEEVELIYTSQLSSYDFAEQLKYNVKKDIQRQFTTFGIHKDDLDFIINEMPIKKFGSQGQQKSFLIALKLAQLEFLKKVVGQNPILLLDDVFDKLDELRVKQLLELVNSNDFGQIFLTDTDIERIKRVLPKVNMDYSVYEVNSSLVSKINI